MFLHPFSSIITNYLNYLNMNKYLLFLIVASLMVMSANAQVRNVKAATVPVQSQELSTARLQPMVQEMQMREPGTAVARAPQRADRAVDVWYRRPAGAFPASFAVEDGVMIGYFPSPFFTVKPFSQYTFNGFAQGLGPDVSYWWEYYADDGNLEDKDLNTSWEIEMSYLPVFHANEYTASMPGHGLPASSSAITNGESIVVSMNNTMEYWGYDLLKSSKSFYTSSSGGSLVTYYSGAAPFKDNRYGWWFGKNGYHNMASPSYFIDGLAQAFEKPEHPYLLNQVVLFCNMLTVAPGSTVEMHCKVYKLDEIPDYLDDESAILPDEPGELIAVGRATVTGKTSDETGGLVTFNFYNEENGVEHRVSPAIESAILVVVDGYNDSGMDNLTDFTAMISVAMDQDDGFGELAYLKFGRPNENGGVDYVWSGLENFFNNTHIKTGFTLFLCTDLPFIVFNDYNEDGFYEFPKQGGLMEKVIGEVTYRSIEFFSSKPSEDGAWTVTCDGGEIPDWLSIELTDEIEDGEFFGLVTAQVVAEPLPAGVSYRMAVVRFEHPGAYIDYVFTQGVTNGITEQLDTKDAVVVGCYDLMGRQLQDLQPGLNILRMSDGTARKILKK